MTTCLLILLIPDFQFSLVTFSCYGGLSEIF